MPYPSPPEISTSYTAQEQALGDGTLPGQELDVDLASIRASITEVINFVRGITRSDGALANGVVTQEALSAALVIGFDPPAPWATGTAYTTRSIVFQNLKIYLGLVAHTSGDFATDLASSRWLELADLTPPGGALIASNSLSDVADVGNARSNLGLGTLATANSGTGSSQYRTNAQNEAVFQPLVAGLTSWAAITRAAGFDTFVATPTSANLRALLTDESGSGALLFAGGALGTPASGVLTNCTGLPLSGIDPASVVTLSETIAANVNDTTVPTSAAVFAVASRILLASRGTNLLSTVDFTEFNNSVWRYYEFEMENVLPNTDATAVIMRFSTNGGVSYDATVGNYAHSGMGNSAAAPFADSNNANGAIRITANNGVGNAAGELGVTGTVKMFHAGDASTHSRVLVNVSYEDTSSQITIWNGTGRRLANQITNAVRFLPSSGIFAATSGLIRMYGIR